MVILDRAAAHMCNVFKTLAKQFNIILDYIVGYRPQSNSAAEQIHSKILTSLRACLIEYPTKPWTEFLSHTQWAHNMSLQTHGYAPYELLLGIKQCLSCDMELEAPALTEAHPPKVLEFLWPDLAFMCMAATRNAPIDAENMKARYDRRQHAK